MEGDITIEDITKEVESASTNFEKTNTELKINIHKCQI